MCRSGGDARIIQFVSSNSVNTICDFPGTYRVRVWDRFEADVVTFTVGRHIGRTVEFPWLAARRLY